MRLWAPGWLLSIVGRGHEGRPLFGTDEDRRFFVERLAKVFTADAVDLLAWALLVGVPGAAISVARRRGAALLASRGWTVDEVIAWCEPAGPHPSRESPLGGRSRKLIT